MNDKTRLTFMLVLEHVVQQKSYIDFANRLCVINQKLYKCYNDSKAVAIHSSLNGFENKMVWDTRTSAEEALALGMDELNHLLEASMMNTAKINSLLESLKVVEPKMFSELTELVESWLVGGNAESIAILDSNMRTPEKYKPENMDEVKANNAFRQTINLFYKEVN